MITYIYFGTGLFFVLFIVFAMSLTIGPATYRVSHTNRSNDDRPWLVQVRPKYSLMWLTESTHQTKTDAQFAHDQLAQKRRSY